MTNADKKAASKVVKFGLIAYIIGVVADILSDYYQQKDSGEDSEQDVVRFATDNFKESILDFLPIFAMLVAFMYSGLKSSSLK